jgi:hypothetical protein
MNPALMLAACLLPLHALACPVPELLAARYGITFSGFATPLPAAAAPDTRSGGPWLRLRLPDKGDVQDGFRHSVLIDAAAKQGWILRTGGFIGVYQWYGPVDLRDIPLGECLAPPPPAPPRAPGQPVILRRSEMRQDGSV